MISSLKEFRKSADGMLAKLSSCSCVFRHLIVLTVETVGMNVNGRVFCDNKKCGILGIHIEMRKMRGMQIIYNGERISTSHAILFKSTKTTRTAIKGFTLLRESNCNRLQFSILMIFLL